MPWLAHVSSEHVPRPEYSAVYTCALLECSINRAGARDRGDDGCVMGSCFVQNKLCVIPNGAVS